MVQQVLSKQEKKASKSTLMKVLHQKYKYSDQHPESRAFQLYDKLISKISLDMASSQTGYMLGMVGWSSFNGMDKEDQIKYKTDINRLTASVDKKLIQRLKEQGLSDQKTVMAIILYASRDKSYDSLSSLYRGSVIDACKSEMENQIREAFRVQVEDIYAKQALALKKMKRLRENKEKTPDNETKADTVLISMEELSELLDPSCEKESSYSAHYYRKQLQDESRKLETKGLPEKVSMEGSGVNEFGDVQESPEEPSDEILSDDVKEHWKQVLLDDKFQKGSTQFACINHCLEDLRVRLKWGSIELERTAMPCKLKIQEMELPVYHISHGKFGSVNGATLIFSRVNSNFELLAVARHSGTANGETSYRCLWTNPVYKVPRTLSMTLATTITKLEPVDLDKRHPIQLSNFVKSGGELFKNFLRQKSCDRAV